MKVYTNTSFKGHYPVGTAAVVVANSPKRAAELLNEALVGGLEGNVKAVDMSLVKTSKELVDILNNGDY